MRKRCLWPPRMGTPPRGTSGTVADGETPHQAPGASEGRPGPAGRDGLSQLGRNPARITLALTSFAGQHAGHRIRIVTEPLWPGALRRRDRRDGLLHGVVARQPVGQARDPQRLGVPVPGPGQGQDPVPRGELLPVPDDDRQRAGVHEVDGGEVEDDAVGLMARRGQVLVELAAGHRVELAADRHDRDLAVAVRRQSEPLHNHSPRTASTQSNRTRPIVCANDVSWPPRMGTPPRGTSGTVAVGGEPRLRPGEDAEWPGRHHHPGALPPPRRVAATRSGSPGRRRPGPPRGGAAPTAPPSR